MTSRTALAPPVAMPLPALDLDLDIALLTQPSTGPFPYAYGMNGSTPQPLAGWAQLRDLLQLVGLTRDCSFLIAERTDASGRWAQAIGRADELIVELGLPDAPMRVTRTDAAPSSRLVPTASSTVVEARAGELFTAAEAVELMRAWLETATLGGEGTALRTPDDWR